MKPTKIKTAIDKSIEDIVRNNQLYCANNNIRWTNEHNDCLRDAIRDFYELGLWPILKELFEFDDRIVKNNNKEK